MYKLIKSKANFQKFAKVFPFNNSFLLLLAYEFFKTWNYDTDSNTHVCLCMQAISRFRFTVIDMKGYDDNLKS